MRWELSAEQSDFRSVLRGWLVRRCSSADLRGWLDTGDPGPFEHQFVAQGWAAVGSPGELGGQGGGLVELALVAEELGRSGAPSSARLGSGLVGSVASVLGADRARRLVVPVRRSDGVALVLLDRDATGVEVRSRALTDRTRTAADVVLAGAPGVDVAGVDIAGNVAAALEETALRAAVLVSADALGVAERMLEMAVEYAKQRHQFGVPIGSFQAVKHAAAQMLVQVEAARSIVYLAAAAVQAGHPGAPLYAAAAKAQVTQGVAEAADVALTLHGAIGYTWEHDLQLFYKRAKLDRVLFGAPVAWNERIAALLDLAPSGV